MVTQNLLLDYRVREKLEPLIDEFELALRQDQSPRIEDWKHRVDPDSWSYLFGELLAIEVEHASSQQGLIDRDSYVKRFPELTVEIDSVLTKVQSDIARQTTVYRRTTPTSDTIPDSIGAYKVIRFLGRGGFANVFLCHDDSLDRLRAVKVPRSDREFSVDELSQFANEAKVAAQFDELPGIVRVFNVGEDSGRPYIVSQFIDGETLQNRLSRGPLDHDAAAMLVAQIARTMSEAHKKQFFHRDLKPANILVDKQGLPYVADFGLAIARENQHAHYGEIAGTLAYMAPEQIRGESNRLDGRSDIWGLGVILYQTLTGKLPFGTGSLASRKTEILTRDPTPLRQLNDKIPVALEAVCLKCLQKEPSDRFSNAADLATALDQCTVQLKPISRTKVALAIAVAAILAAVTLSRIGGHDVRDVDSYSRVGAYSTVSTLRPVEEFCHRANVSFDAKVGQTTVETTSLAVLSYGFTSANDYELTAKFSQHNWQGSAGLFWGGHHSNGKYSIKQIRFRVLMTKVEGRLQYELVEIAADKNGELYSTSGSPYCELGLAIPTAQDCTLRLVIRNRKLDEVWWNEKRTQQTPGTATLMPVENGDFGVVVTDSLTVVKEVRFLPLSPN